MIVWNDRHSSNSWPNWKSIICFWLETMQYCRPVSSPRKSVSHNWSFAGSARRSDTSTPVYIHAYRQSPHPRATAPPSFRSQLISAVPCFSEVEAAKKLPQKAGHEEVTRNILIQMFIFRSLLSRQLSLCMAWSVLIQPLPT